PRALSLARGLLGAFPESPACQFYAGTLELAAGDPAAAARILERAAQGQPRNVPIRLNLAVAYLKTGRPAQAQEQARAVLELDPNNGQAKAIVGAGR
ncbi:MAG TPA: tetratricopeptide repeat protein, partial [Elusimicrobiota bacterium]|nr:tetratricopeptide repeat protein [Elusimicrobiota bacterium]